MILSLLYPYGEALLRLFYPASCGRCRHLLEMEESGLCAACRSDLEKSAYSLEEACSLRRFEFLDEAWALYPYESPAGEILSAVKFLSKQWLIKIFEEAIAWLSEGLRAETSYDAIVPIPLDRLRLFEREFNQADLIAGLVSKHMGIPVKKILRKVRRTFSQSGLGRKARQINLFQAFRVQNVSCAEGKSYLLIDDVLTTGATSEEAARTLKKAGAVRVNILTVARTESWKDSQESPQGEV